MFEDIIKEGRISVKDFDNAPRSFHDTKQFYTKWMHCVPGVEQPSGYPLGPAAVGLGVSDVVEVDSQLPLAPDEGHVLAVDHHHVVAAVVQRVVDGLQVVDCTDHMSCLIAMAENHAFITRKANADEVIPRLSDPSIIVYARTEKRAQNEMN